MVLLELPLVLVKTKHHMGISGSKSYSYFGLSEWSNQL